MTLNAWNHVAVTRDTSNQVRAFINGVKKLDVAGPVGALYWNNSDIVITGNQLTGVNRPTNCNHDLLRITKKCRYTANFTPPDDYPPLS
jgi:hypothetical protein